MSDWYLRAASLVLPAASCESALYSPCPAMSAPRVSVLGSVAVPPPAAASACCRDETSWVFPAFVQRQALRGRGFPDRPGRDRPPPWPATPSLGYSFLLPGLGRRLGAGE